jgi:hypothetical protein
VPPKAPAELPNIFKAKVSEMVETPTQQLKRIIGLERKKEGDYKKKVTIEIIDLKG